MSLPRLNPSEMQFLKEALITDQKICNIRLREGEYQYILAKTIASFQLELHFPDVKDIIKKMYGREKVNDVKFIRRIQTILKKMEKSNVVKILQKRKPWELQKYALLSFKFLDTDNNLVILATEQQIKQTQDALHFALSQQETSADMSSFIRTKIFILMFIVFASYAVIVWDLIQPTINPIIFVPAFSIAVVCSLMLGKILS